MGVEVLENMVVVEEEQVDTDLPTTMKLQVEVPLQNQLLLA